MTRRMVLLTLAVLIAPMVCLAQPQFEFENNWFDVVGSSLKKCPPVKKAVLLDFKNRGVENLL